MPNNTSMRQTLLETVRKDWLSVKTGVGAFGKALLKACTARDWANC